MINTLQVTSYKLQVTSYKLHRYIWITGRVDDVINTSGHRIGTAEVGPEIAPRSGRRSRRDRAGDRAEIESGTRSPAEIESIN